MKRIKRQSINLKAKAIDLQKIKANNAPNTDEHNPADRGRHMQLGAAAAEPIPMHVQDVTFLLTAQKQRRQRRSSSSVLTEVDVLTAPSMGQEWSQRKKGERRSSWKSSPWPLIGYLTLWQLSTRLDCSTVGRIRQRRRMPMRMRMRIRMWTDTHSYVRVGGQSCPVNLVVCMLRKFNRNSISITFFLPHVAYVACCLRYWNNKFDWGVRDQSTMNFDPSRTIVRKCWGMQNFCKFALACHMPLSIETRRSL